VDEQIKIGVMFHCSNIEF